MARQQQNFLERIISCDFIDQRVEKRPASGTQHRLRCRCGSAARRHAGSASAQAILDKTAKLVPKAGGRFVVSSAPRLNGLYAVAQSSKIIERLNFHRICRLGNFDDKDLILVLFHSLMNVCEMNEVIFRDQGIFRSIFVVDGDRPSRAHCNSPKLPDAVVGNDCVFLIAAKGQKGDTAANLRPSAPLAH
jgi:hypothetical protein